MGAPPLPEREIRLQFITRYAEDSGRRLNGSAKTTSWWEALTTFFDVPRSRAWVISPADAHRITADSKWQC
jgi:hypothetical protein